MWVRDLKSPPQALALFQIYHRFAPLTSFSGPIWRYQVDQDVSLQAFLMPGQSHGSFLHLRRGPTLTLRPPLMRIEGQLEALFPSELPLLDWMAQGTRWWLRNLGSVDLDNPMRLGLLHGLAEMDRSAFPDLDAAVAYHPIVPLCDGSWLSLEELRKYARVYSAEVKGMAAQPGWHGDSPIVQSLVAKSLASLLSVELEVLENDQPAPENVVTQQPAEPDQPYEPSLLRQLNWTQKVGENRMQARFLAARDGLSEVAVLYGGEAVERERLQIFPDWPVSLEIRLFLTNRPRRAPTEGWLEILAKALLDGLETPLRLLQTYPEGFHEVCCLVGIALQSGRTPPGWVWDILDEDGNSLGQQLGDGDPLTTIRELLKK